MKPILTLLTALLLAPPVRTQAQPKDWRNLENAISEIPYGPETGSP